MSKVIAAVLLSTLAAGNAQAQSTFIWQAPEAPTNARTVKYFLPMGTPLMLRTRTQVNTRESKLGDHVSMEVAEPVMFRGQTVIPVGAPVSGEIATLQRNGHFGRKGKIGVRLIEVQTPSGPVRLSGEAYDEGRSGTAVSIGTIAFVSVLGFLVHGTSGDIPAQSSVQGYLAERMNFRWQQPDGEQDVATARAIEATPSTSAAYSQELAAAVPAG